MKPSYPSYPCAVALSLVAAVLCAGKSNSTTGTIGAARVWLLLWVSLEFSFTQIVFRLRCEEGASGKVLRVRGRVYPGREAINWALGVDLEPVPVSSERKICSKTCNPKFKPCTWDWTWFAEKRTMKRNLTICKPTWRNIWNHEVTVARWSKDTLELGKSAMRLSPERGELWHLCTKAWGIAML